MNNKSLKLTIIGLMAGLAYISFTFLQIKIPTPGGTTSFHLGNTFVLIGSMLLGGFYGGIAGSIGMGIGDILDPVYITVAPKTIVLKLGIGLVCGYVAHRIFKIDTLEGKKLKTAVVLSATAGMIFNIISEPIFSYFYTRFILGAHEKAALALASFNIVTTSINAVLAVIISSSLFLAIQPVLKRNGILGKLK